MALSDMWGLTPKNEDAKVTCPVCVGSGKDISTLDCPCYTCYGTGEVTKEQKTKLQEMRY